MAFKMKNPSVMKMAKMAGNNRTAMKMKAEEAAAMKMKKAAMKLREEKAAMKLKEAAAMKMKSAMKADKPDFPDIDGDGNTSESMKKAAADKKSGMKMKKSPAKMGHSPKKMKKSAMKLEGDPKKEMTQAEKDAAIANAMPAAEKSTLSKETVAGMKTYFGGVNADIDDVKLKIRQLKVRTQQGASAKNQAKFEAELKEARRIAKARYPQFF